MSDESNYRICKGACKQMKLRKYSGRFPDGKNKIWVDETGKRWNGSICHDCTNERLKIVMKNKPKKTEVPE